MHDFSAIYRGEKMYTTLHIYDNSGIFRLVIFIGGKKAHQKNINNIRYIEQFWSVLSGEKIAQRKNLYTTLDI